MTLQINIGTNVYASDGDHVGDVDELVIDAATNSVAYLIIDKKRLGTGRLVPFRAVHSADGKSVHLSASRDEVERMQSYIEKDFVQMTDASGYVGMGMTAHMPQSGWMMVGPGTGDIPATGTMGVFATPITGEVVTQEVSNISENSVRIDEGTDVVDASFEKIGRVDEVLLNERGGIAGFIMLEGRLVHHKVEIPIGWVAGIASDHVRLTKTAEAVSQEAKKL